MSAATYLVGDVFDVMATMPDASVDLVLTSPPFLALRSYLPADHPDKHKEIGSEPTPAEFIDTLLALTAEWGRLIAPHGSIAVELGDTYAGSGGAGGDYDTGKIRGDQSKFGGSKLADRKNKVLNESGQRMQQGAGWPLDKSMCVIPHLYAASLAYGRNILTGAESPAGMWRVRNVVAWCRPNPAVGALGDKFRPATSFMVIACKARDRYFDLDAVRVPTPSPPASREVGMASASKGISGGDSGNPDKERMTHNPAGAPPLDHVGLRDGEADLFTEDSWLVSTEAYPGSHYATWPRKLLDRPIKAMVPHQVCTTCGEPRRRMVDVKCLTGRDILGTRSENNRDIGLQGPRPPMPEITRTTTGWTDCGHDTWRNGHVLDPFGGSGTTAVVATGHGHDCTLIDLDERNAELARERVGMFLTIVEPEAVA